MLRVLFIGLVWPEPTSSAAGWRILHLVKLLLQNHEVHFASAASRSPFSYDLQSLGVVEHDIKLNDCSFNSFVTNLNPAVVFFDRFMVEEQYGWRVAESVPHALRILDTEDLHFLRLARQEAYKKQSSVVDYYTDTAKREIASILRSDLSLIISKFEMNLLKEEFKVDAQRLFFMPFQEEKLATTIVRSSFENRKNFVFIGNFIHEPNWRTVERIKRHIWPLLRKKLPTAEMHIYGAYASEKVNQLHNPKERFFIKGRAEDAREVIEKYKVLLAPIPFGAGAKGKFVDAMYAGTPTVTTSVGAENMMLDNEWAGFIADDDESIIEKAVQLYVDDAKWEEFQQQGYHIFNETVADTSCSTDFLTWIDVSKDQVASIRKSNFIGQLLQQQQFNATKYMSLWIEQKNIKGK